MSIKCSDLARTEGHMTVMCECHPVDKDFSSVRTMANRARDLNNSESRRRDRSRRSTLSRLSESISDSLRIRKKRNGASKSDSMQANTKSCGSVYLEDLNKSRSCLNHSILGFASDAPSWRETSVNNDVQSYVVSASSDSCRDVSGSHIIREGYTDDDVSYPSKYRRISPSHFCTSFAGSEDAKVSYSFIRDIDLDLHRNEQSSQSEFSQNSHSRRNVHPSEKLRVLPRASYYLSKLKHSGTFESSKHSHNRTFDSSKHSHNRTIESSTHGHNRTFDSPKHSHNRTIESSTHGHNRTFDSFRHSHNPAIESSTHGHNRTFDSSKHSHSLTIGSSKLSYSRLRELSKRSHNRTLKSIDPHRNPDLPIIDNQAVAACDMLSVPHYTSTQNTNPARFSGSQCLQDYELNESFLHGWSLTVGEDASTAAHKLMTACSVHNIASNTNDHGTVGKTGRVASWAVHFDKLLQDPLGIKVFTGFLEKEFSDENIRFWKVCEQFRSLPNEQQDYLHSDNSISAPISSFRSHKEDLSTVQKLCGTGENPNRKTQAKEIYACYLSPKASDPINVDNTARSYTETFLDNPIAIMFDVAQNQILQLMKQDSYPRFLKSDLYKNMLVEELEERTQKGHNDLENISENKCDKKQNIGKENSGKRRRSILPWKHYQKSNKATSDCEPKKLQKKGKEGTINHCSNNQLNVYMSGHSTTTTTNIASSSSSNKNTNNSVGNVKKSTGLGIDLSTMRKEVFHQKEVHGCPESQVKFCRIIMPDGSTTVVCAKPGQTSRCVLSKLCEKRSISIGCVDVFLLGSDRPLDLNEDISTLGSKEIVIEKRVLFHLDLPDGKSVEAKVKPNRSIQDVLKPILNKYGYSLDNIDVRVISCQDTIDLEMPVSKLDSHRIVVTLDSETAGTTNPGSQKQKVPLFGLFRASEKRVTENKGQGDLR